MSADFDLAIVGSGFSGSLLAMIARRLGRSVILLERGRHPRFAIGESSTPLANLLLEQVAQQYGLPRLVPLAKWGAWQRHYPDIACGLKRGFTFYFHKPGEAWQATPDRHNELLVAASPRDAIADTHWYRADFDAFLVREAVAAGVEFSDATTIQDVQFEAEQARLCALRGGKAMQIKARFVVDATGPRGCLYQLLRLKDEPFEFLPATCALYSHFGHVQRLEEQRPAAEAPPYPIDDAAVHHVFPGGWIWVLRFNNGITSAGVAATAQLSTQLRLADGEPAWERLLEQLPSVRRQFQAARTTFPFVYAPRLSFRAEAVSGPRWLMLPSAAGFIDPLLSTGFPLTLLGLTRLGQLLERQWGKPAFVQGVERYAEQTRRELRIAERLIAALYSSLHDAGLFSGLSLLYFAAASFTEAALRLGKPALAGASFLLDEHPQFGPLARTCVQRVLHGSCPRSAILAAVRQAVACVDVAGLADPARRHWHPARAEDLLAASSKLCSSREAILAMLQRTGFAPDAP